MAEPAEKRKKRLMVMVADDDREFLQEVVQALDLLSKEFNFQVVPSLDGLDAMQSFDTLLPEIVILDLMLPKRGGFQVLTRWKGTAKNKGKLPIVIMVTGNEGERHGWYAESIGVDEYLKKPFSMPVLLDLLREYLLKLPKLEWVDKYKGDAESMGNVEFVQKPIPAPTKAFLYAPELKKIRRLKIAAILIISISAILLALFVLWGIYGFPL